MELLGKIGGVAFFEGGVLQGMGYEVAEAHTRSSLFLSCACGSDVQLLLQCHACLPAAVLATMIVMDSPSESVSKFPVQYCLGHGVSIAVEK